MVTMTSHKPTEGKHSCHTWLDRWTAYTVWRQQYGVTSSAVHQAVVNFLVDAEPTESITVAALVQEARIIQHNRTMKRGGEA